AAILLNFISIYIRYAWYDWFVREFIEENSCQPTNLNKRYQKEVPSA
ncbi:12645_t:CDS:1, partial [Dentiscutata erythropus]